MIAEILSVGTELLLGEIVNTDAQFLASELSKLGINVYHQTVVGDNPKRLKEAILLALLRSDLLITSGGLGPTSDDITKEVVCEAMGAKLVMDTRSLTRIKAYFKQMNREMAKINEKQAILPKDGIILDNNCGTAPGGIVEKDGKIAIFLPGPPRELTQMFTESVRPYLIKRTESILYSKTLRIAGIGESRVEELLSDLMQTSENPTVAPYAKTDEVTLRLTARCKDDADGEALIAPVEAKIRAILGDAVYGVNEDTIFSCVLSMLKKRQMTVSFAESCTGGLLAAKLTDLPGASAVLRESYVTYCDAAKTKILGVDPALLEDKGAVSYAVCAAMAEGLYKISGSDLCISITGVAGPDKDDLGNPVGLVYLGICDGKNTNVQELHFAGSRERIRNRAAINAYMMIRNYLSENEKKC